MRLTEVARVGLVDDERWNRFETKKYQFENEIETSWQYQVKTCKGNQWKVTALGFKPLTDAVAAKEFYVDRGILSRCCQFYRTSCEELDDKIIELIGNRN